MNIPTPLLQTQFGNHRMSWQVVKLPAFEAVVGMLQHSLALAEQSPHWRSDGPTELLISRKVAALRAGIRDLEAFSYQKIADMVLLSLARAVTIAINLDPENEAPISNNRFEIACWLQTLVARLAERRGGDLDEMRRYYEKHIREVLGDCVVLGELTLPEIKELQD